MDFKVGSRVFISQYTQSAWGENNGVIGMVGTYEGCDVGGGHSYKVRLKPKNYLYEGTYYFNRVDLKPISSIKDKLKELIDA